MRKFAIPRICATRRSDFNHSFIMEPLINNPGYQHIVEDIFFEFGSKRDFPMSSSEKILEKIFPKSEKNFLVKEISISTPYGLKNWRCKFG